MSKLTLHENNFSALGASFKIFSQTLGSFRKYIIGLVKYETKQQVAGSNFLTADFTW